MPVREVSPDTLDVRLIDDGIEVDYLDGRTVFYRGVPQKTTDSVQTAIEKHVHVLVTDASGTEGVLVYVNDRKTAADILASTGVGRVLVEDGDSATVFPGVTASQRGYRIVVDVDFESIDGRVFVFAEDEMSEQSYEVVAGE